MAKANIPHVGPDCWDRLKKGDQTALGELYDTYVDKLFLVASGFTDDRELAKDALQEVFIELWNYRESIGAIQYPHAYLAKVLRSILIKKLKKQPGRQVSFEEIFMGQEASPEDELISFQAGNEMAARLDKAMSRLTTRQKLILRLHYYEGLSYEQIAHKLRMNYQSVNNLAFRTIRHLRSMMMLFFSKNFFTTLSIAGQCRSLNRCMMRFFDFYMDYTIGQFAGDEYFRQWVLQPDEALEQFWSAYQLAHPEQTAMLDLARDIVATETFGRRKMQPLSREEKATLKTGIFARLGSGTPQKETRIIPMKRRPIGWMTAAALLAVTAAIYLLQHLIAPHSGKPVLLAERTSLNEMKTIVLPDSSVVVLNAGSTLQYSSAFSPGGHREVWLTGNAFFQVRRSEDIRKFVVHAGSVSVTVLGTQLNVDARSASTEVALVTGKVRVTVDGREQTPVYLQPGYKACFDTISNSLSLSAVNAQLYSAWKDGKWNFWHTSMEDIGRLINEYYGIRVSFHDPKIKQRSINAVMAVGSLQKLIPVLEQTLHIKMTLSENRLVIE